MWVWFLSGYAVFVAEPIGYTMHFAKSDGSKQHRTDAYKVLRLLYGGVTDASGLIVVGLTPLDGRPP
ncbi:hypothetical protein [Kutzneria sp. 744]|uniref:hypothetical protein n=1 Tax=Kutzneria sp. (strain 744) TaxID=345341 RepID=UPI0005BDE184|nr:hypothetical protein [Kutzneria sp. 744]